MFAFAVRFQQRAHQEHGGAGRADDARQHTADREKRRIGHRMGRQVPLQTNSARNRIEGEQQHDERNELGENRIGQNRRRRAHIRAVRHGAHQVMSREMSGHVMFVKDDVVEQRDDCQSHRHQELVQVVFPPVSDAADQRKYGDSAEQQQKRELHEQRWRRRRFLGRFRVFTLGGRLGRGMLLVSDDSRRPTLRHAREQTRHVHNQQAADGCQSQGT